MIFQVRFFREKNVSDLDWTFSQPYELDFVPRVGDTITVENYQGTVTKVKYAVRTGVNTLYVVHLN